MRQFLGFPQKILSSVKQLHLPVWKYGYGRKLNWLYKEYLSKYDDAPVDSKIRYQEPFDKVTKKEMLYSIASDESEEDNTFTFFTIKSLEQAWMRSCIWHLKY